MLYHWSYCPLKKAGSLAGSAFEFHFFVNGVFVAAWAILSRLEFLGMSFCIFACRVVDFTTLAALESYIDSHSGLSLKEAVVTTASGFVVRYLMILETTPAPTVRPPSRIAKRVPSSIAIGAMSSAVILTLSPGMTISVPSGSVIAPVTSVVRT